MGLQVRPTPKTPATIRALEGLFTHMDSHVAHQLGRPREHLGACMLPAPVPAPLVLPHSGSCAYVERKV